MFHLHFTMITFDILTDFGKNIEEKDVISNNILLINKFLSTDTNPGFVDGGDGTPYAYRKKCKLLYFRRNICIYIIEPRRVCLNV